MGHEFLFRKRKSSEKSTSIYNIKELWPLIFSYAIISLTHATIAINMIIFSKMMWPGESLRIFEMGLILSFGLWATAISGIIIGGLADRYSRKKLLVSVVLLTGFAYLLNGFAPAGQGNFTWIIFLISSILAGFGTGGIRPLLLSYTNDFLEKDSRSKFFGKYYSIGLFAVPIGMIISAILIQNGLWKQYFWIIGGLITWSAIIIGGMIKEPERGINSSERIKEVLVSSNSTIKYDYRLNKETLKATIFKPTNIVALIEGIFTWVLFGTVQFLMILFLEQEPNNISPVSIAWFMIVFAIPGTLFGSIAFSKKSDVWGKKNIKNRVNLIIFALFLIGIVQMIFFVIPLPGFTLAQGNNILILLQSIWIWVLGALLFTRMMVSIIYNINQPPILQVVNLPEAQGKISSWNQFVETIGQGIGPTIASLLLIITLNNFVSTALILFLISIPGAILWAYGKRKINADKENISRILSKRAEELKLKEIII